MSNILQVVKESAVDCQKVTKCIQCKSRKGRDSMLFNVNFSVCFLYKSDGRWGNFLNLWQTKIESQYCSYWTVTSLRTLDVAFRVKRLQLPFNALFALGHRVEQLYVSELLGHASNSEETLWWDLTWSVLKKLWDCNLYFSHTQQWTLCFKLLSVECKEDFFCEHSQRYTPKRGVPFFCFIEHSQPKKWGNGRKFTEGSTCWHHLAHVKAVKQSRNFRKRGRT